MPLPSPSYSFTIRLKSTNKPGMMGLVTSTIGEQGGDIGAIDIVSIARGYIIRDYTVNAVNLKHRAEIVDALNLLEGIEVVNVSDRTFLIHLGGKITIENKIPLNTRDDLSMSYTPGVARVCVEIARNKEKAYNLTIKKNTIAIVTDGSAVLGLGDIGAEAAIPVMEGKSMLFKKFGGVNAFPLCLNTKDPDKIVETVLRISPIFGGINLEDISSPRCFEIEKRLIEELDIPVFHDDQHGTAIVVLSGIMNALKVVTKEIKDVKIVICGLGAAGIACSNLLRDAGITNLIGVDRAGILYRGREKNMNIEKYRLAERINPGNIKGSLSDAMKGADVFIGVSAPDIVTIDMIKSMSDAPIVFALANPSPEIDPSLAEPYVRILATGRSDYQNQINNALCFPGLFKGLLASKARSINHTMNLAASRAIAAVVGPEEISEDYIIPSIFDSRVAARVATAVMHSAVETGAARKSIGIKEDWANEAV